MLAELALYLELLVYLAGTFLYLFLAQELRRRPQVLPRNPALRLLLACLTLWYSLTLVDELIFMLLALEPLSPSPDSGWGSLHVLGVLIDGARGWAWLLCFPLLVHTLAATLQQEGKLQSRWLSFVSWPGYLGLVVFVQATVAFVRRGEPRLLQATQEIFPWAAGYGAVLLLVTAVLAGLLSRQVRDARLLRFLLALRGVLGLMIVLLVAGALSEPWSPEPSAGERFLRTALLTSLLLPGILFAYYVQRYNLLRLSLSHRTVRHFGAVLFLMMLVMLGGPAVDDFVAFRRVVAWGLLLALFVGLAYEPLKKRLLERSITLRRLLGENVRPSDLDRLMRSVQRSDLSEEDALAHAAAELGDWLGAEAAFLPRPEEAGWTTPFWEHYEDPAAPLLHRLELRAGALVQRLDRHSLHAVFPLRVAGRLEGLLALEVSPTSGGYDGTELEAVQLLVRQLAATLALRRLTETRVAAERHLAEQAESERLRTLGLVAASLAHEVKNPLSSMKVLAQTLREDLTAIDDDRLADGVADLDLILEQIERLDRTTREMLGLARPSAGATTELAPLVRSCVYVLRAEARKRGVELVYTEIEEVGEVPGSETAWQTVVFNLMLNAVEHSGAGETAEVELRREPKTDAIVLTTRNPGAPLSAEDAKRLFEPFVSDGGTGLGLALVARRLDELQATVAVSAADGRVIFTVRQKPQP